MSDYRSIYVWLILEIYCRGPNYQSMNQSMNQSMKKESIFWNDKERVLSINLRTRNIWKVRHGGTVDEFGASG